MSTIRKLYDYLDNIIPKEFSCEWDNDGNMCIPDGSRRVKKVLICLDISEKAIDYAIENGFDCIISHHPLIFSPIKNIDEKDHTASKLCKLIRYNISAFSFHTRLDKVSEGVNDMLAEAIGMKNVTEFSDVGRMGDVDEQKVSDFACMIKERLKADRVIYVDSGRKVSKIAIVGGSGKGYLEEALQANCDTFVTGEMPYNCEHDALEMGINLVCGGHYFTENLVCFRIEKLVKCFDESIKTEIIETKPTVTV